MGASPSHFRPSIRGTCTKATRSVDVHSLCLDKWEIAALSRPQPGTNQSYASQMQSFLNITRHPYEEPHHVNLVVSAGNASTQATMDVYANATDLKDAAISITGFPKTGDDTFIWELGSENERDRFAFYFRLRVFQFSSTGRCAIELRFNNNQKPPVQQVVEFCIEAYPADLDRLGVMLKSFSRLEDTTMEWTVHSGT